MKSLTALFVTLGPVWFFFANHDSHRQAKTGFPLTSLINSVEAYSNDYAGTNGLPSHSQRASRYHHCTESWNFPTGFLCVPSASQTHQCQARRDNLQKQRDTNTEAESSGCSHTWANVDPFQRNLTYVHVIPHSHQDVGWLKTVDQYFTGLNNSIQYASVNAILSSVVHALEPATLEAWGSCTDRTFSIVEAAYLWRWWRQQGDSVRRALLKRIKHGAIALISGGWTMHDEATAYYLDILDQMTLGHHFLNWLGIPVPSTGWQIDPFGHSLFTAWLFESLGFNGVIVGRIDYQDLRERVHNNALEFLWEVPEITGDNTKRAIFYSILRQSYSYPAGFCLDSQCQGSTPFQTDIRYDGYNLNERLGALYHQLNSIYSQGLRSKHVPLPMGSDFTFHSAEWNYKFLDSLVSNANTQTNQSGYVFLYSTPATYVAAVLSSVLPFRYGTTNSKAYCQDSTENLLEPYPVAGNADYTFPAKTSADDFFPYADAPGSYWTGFYTTRPNLKYMIRITSGLKNAFEKLVTLYWIFYISEYSFPESFVNASTDTFSTFGPFVPSLTSRSLFTALFSAQETLAVVQHHDAVSGTSKLHVIKDYAKRLSSAATQMSTTMSLLIQKIVNLRLPLFMEQPHVALLPTNVSYSFSNFGFANRARNHPTSSGTQYVIAVFNPLSWTPPPKELYIPIVDEVKLVFRVTLERLSSTATGVPVWKRESGCSAFTENPFYRPGYASHSRAYALVILTQLSPMEITVFRVTLDPAETLQPDSSTWVQFWEPVQSLTTISTLYYKLQLNTSGLQTLQFRDKNRQESVNLSHRYEWFESRNGSQPSGYYIFAPAKKASNSTRKKDKPAAATVHTVPVVHVYRSYTAELKAVDASGCFYQCSSKNARDTLLSKAKLTSPAYLCESVLLLYSNMTAPFNAEPLTRSPLASPVYLRLSLCPTAKDIRVEWSLGPLNLEDRIGKEVVSVIATNVVHNSTFVTDSNGYFRVPRMRNKRPSYVLNQTDGEDIEASNFYPITTSIGLTGHTNATEGGQDLHLSLLVDRATGAASLSEGEISLMLHRLTLNDDIRGVGEPFNDTEPDESGDGLGQRVSGEYRLRLSFAGDDTYQEVSTAEVEIYNRPVVAVGNTLPPSSSLLASYTWHSSSLHSEFASKLYQFIPLLELTPSVQLVSLHPVPAIPSTNQRPCILCASNSTLRFEMVMRLRNMQHSIKPSSVGTTQVNSCQMFRRFPITIEATVRTRHNGLPDPYTSRQKSPEIIEDPCRNFSLAPKELATFFIVAALHPNVLRATSRKG